MKNKNWWKRNQKLKNREEDEKLSEKTYLDDHLKTRSSWADSIQTQAEIIPAWIQLIQVNIKLILNRFDSNSPLSLAYPFTLDQNIRFHTKYMNLSIHYWISALVIFG